MTTYTNINATSSRPVINASSAAVETVHRCNFTVSAALELDDLIKMINIPHNHIVTGCSLISEDLDTDGTPAIVLAVGFLNTAGNDIEDNMITDSTIGQAGGVEYMNDGAAYFAGVNSTERTVTIKVTTGPATGATGVKIGLVVKTSTKGLDD